MAVRTFFVITRKIGDGYEEYMDWCRSWCSNPFHGKRFTTRHLAEEYLVKYRKDLGAENISYYVTDHENFRV